MFFMLYDESETLQLFLISQFFEDLHVSYTLRLGGGRGWEEVEIRRECWIERGFNLLL
jgi:hypothetical protein